jgi:hypothetical protein
MQIGYAVRVLACEYACRQLRRVRYRIVTVRKLMASPKADAFARPRGLVETPFQQAS